MKVLLLGAGGQLGQAFLRTGELARQFELDCASRDGRQGIAADLANSDQVLALLDRTRPQIIINAAAYTRVDRAEQEEDLATRINGQLPGLLGRWALEHDSLVIHFSTDYVFDGHTHTAYLPNAEPAPINAYGRSKLAGEIALGRSGAKHLIFRTAWVYDAWGNNFFNTMLKLGREKEELRVVADQYGSPTPTHLIVKGTLAALDKWTRSDTGWRSSLPIVHHLVSSGTTTWHEFADAIFKEAIKAGLPMKVQGVLPISTLEFPTPARRPSRSTLDNSSFTEYFSFELPPWQAGMIQVFEELSS